MNITPIRTDIATRKTYPKSDLLRFVATSGVVVLDQSKSMPGRGVYLYPDIKCLELAIKKRLFERHLHASLDEATIQRVKELL